MKLSLWKRLRDLWQAELFSPKDFVRRAVFLGLAFALAHLCGLRDSTSVVMGTTGSAEMSRAVSSLGGVTYILLYLAVGLLAPALLLGAIILLAWRRIISRIGSCSTSGASSAQPERSSP
jgi:hypothetical protein